MTDTDVLVIGGGIGGAAAAYELAGAGRRVLVIERESQPGYHTTGRSAALFTETYGDPIVATLAAASRDFLDHPPAGFTATPLLKARGVVLVATAGDEDEVEQQYRAYAPIARELRLLDAAAVNARVPVFRPGFARLGFDEPLAMEIDVHALLQGYLRGLKARGGELWTDAELHSLRREGDVWRAETARGPIRARQVVNAAGAWTDGVAALAGLAPLGMMPLRRTIIVVDGGIDPTGLPMVVEARERFYFKPESGRLLASPGDETPSPPCDAQPEEMDIAVTIDRVEAATRFTVRALHAKWAGLRTFAPDRRPVIGPDSRAPGFFWLAGQGGYGIMGASAMGRVLAGLATLGRIPDDLARAGITAEALAPARFFKKS